MAEKILNTRIQLKYGTLSEWQQGKYNKSEKLKKGEIAVVTLGPDVETNHPTDTTNTHPILFKVGTGEHYFDALPWASALAADVYDWAKAPTKPAYTASEITGLDEYIAGEIQDTDTDTQYRFAVEGGALSVYKTVYTLGVAGTETKVGSYDFLTSDELTEILKNYYTKTEVDNLIQGVNDKIDGLDESVTTVAKGTGITVTDSGEGNDHAYTVALDVDGAKTALGLDAEGIAAYATVASLNTTAEGYANAVKTGVENGTIKAKTAEHADSAGKVDNALTVKVGGTDVVFDGSAAKTADVDSAIAAAIIAIPEVVHPEYSIVKDATSEYAATYHLTKDGVNVGAAINIPKDLVVESGKVETLEAGVWGEAGTYIVLTLANATNDKIYVRVDSLIEYVTSGSTADSQVIVNIDENHKVTATIGAGKVGMTELSDEVKNAIAKDDNTTYSFAKKTGTDLTFTVTPSEGAAYDVTLEAGLLAVKDKIAEGDIEGTIGISKITNFANEVKAIKVDNASSADNAGKLGGKAASDYQLVSEALKIADVNSAISTELDNHEGIDKVGTVTSVSAGEGLKITGTASEAPKVEIDDSVIFVFNCGDAEGKPIV